MKQIFLVFFLLMIAGCGSDPASSPDAKAGKEIVVRINDYELTKDEFNDRINFEADTNPGFDVTDYGIEEFLDYLIKREVLIQTAKNQGFDRKEKFLKAIERYWKSTLIRDLIEHKNSEFKNGVIVTTEEVKGYYDDHKEQFGQPLEVVSERIRKRLRSEKQTRRIQEWVQCLIDAADIEVSEDLK